MQNWNQWQLPAAAVTAPMPQPPIGYAAPGADPMATMQAYMQYYNQPAPSGYTAEQWAVAQQQNWVQWQTWQQQYQQWQAQYGEKYQETMKQMSSQGLPGLAQVPPLPVIQPPPLPKEDTAAKPPLPPESGGYGFAGMPPPHQNNLPLFPSKQSANPPLPPGQPPLPPDNSQTSANDGNLNGKRGASSNVDTGSAKKFKIEDDELTEAEKTFDAQFKQWEEQFNKWKQQNANHPDKTQYKQYEAKWTSWREKLIERREQMRRKREQQKQVAAKAEAEKNKTMSGGDKILNILSSTENQGLINNLLGIGKTLGLTGKQEVPGPPPGQPPAPLTSQPLPAQHPMAMGPPTMTPNMNHAAWAAQQWAAQYNAGMGMPNYGPGYQQSGAVPPPAVIPPPAVNNLATPMLPTNYNQPPAGFNQPGGNFNQPPGNFNQPPGNFNQPPGNFNQPPGNYNMMPSGMPAGAPNMSNAPPNLSAAGPNFSLPPPAIGGSDVSRQQSNSGQEQRNAHDSNPRPFRNDGDQRQSAPFNRDAMSTGNDRFGFDGNRFSGPLPNDRPSINRGGQFGSSDNYGRDENKNDFGSSNQCGMGSDNFRRDGSGKDFSPSGRSGNFDFRSNDRLGNDNNRFGSGFDRDQGDRCERDGDKQDQGNNRFGSDRDSFNPDRFNNSSDRFGLNNDRFNLGNDRFGSSTDRFGSGNDRFGSGNDRFGSGNDRFGSGNDRFSSGNDRPGASIDRPGAGNDRLSLGNDQSRPTGDRFGLSNDRFSSGDDKFGSAFGDRFSSLNDRPGLGSDRLGQSNDRFSRPPPDRFDSRDGSRDSLGSNSRNFGKNNQLDPVDDMPPELKKLMEKRRTTMDVFKPSNFSSLLSSDKDNIASTSLSESFRKITGDSLFSSRSDFSNKDSFAPRCPPAGPGGSGNFDSPRDFRPSDNSDLNFRGPGDFRSRGPGNFNLRGPGDFLPRGNEFGLRGPDTTSGPRRLGDFAPRIGNEFEPSRMRNEFEPRNEFESPRKENEHQKDKYDPPDNRGSTSEHSERIMQSSMQEATPSAAEERKDLDETLKPQSPSPNDSNVGLNKQSVPPLQMPPWMDPDFDNDDIAVKPTTKLPEPPIPPFPNADKDTSEVPTDSVPASVNAEEPHEVPEISEKKLDALPFMGENDPKPEDLNMEPPPELPNLGPVIKGPDLPFEERGGNMSGPFGPSSGDFDSRVPFDAPFGPRGMQLGPRGPMPLYGPKGPNDARFPPFGPKTMGGPPENIGPLGPFGPHGPNSGSFGPRGSQDNRLGPRAPTIGAFGPRGQGDFGPRGPSFMGLRGPSDFGPRGPSDFGPRGPSNFGPRGPSDFGLRGSSDFGPRGPSDFGPRGPSDFGPRGPSNFGPRGPSDFGPRGPSDFGPRGSSDFGPRGPSDFGSRGPSNFGPRGPSDFGPRGPSDFGPRGPSDFGPRGPSDFGPRGPSDFGPRGPSDFGPRGPSDFGLRGPSDFGPRGSSNFGPGGHSDFGPRSLSDFGSRGPNDKQPGPRGLGDRPFGSRGLLDFGPSGPNDTPVGPCGPNDTPVGPRGPNNASFGPRGPNDAPFGPRDTKDSPFGPRGPNDAPFGPRDTKDSPFGPRGPNDPPFGLGGPKEIPFGSRDPKDTSFGPRDSNDTSFGPHDSKDTPFGPRDPNDSPFGPRGPKDAVLGPRDPKDALLGPRGPIDSSFGSRGSSDTSAKLRGPNDAPVNPHGPNDALGSHGPNDALGSRGPNDALGSRGPNDTPVGTRGPNDEPFAPRTPLGSNTFTHRGNFDGPQPSIPSLMSFKFDKPIIGGPNDVPPQKNNELEGNRSQELPPAFRAGDQDLRPFAGDELQGDIERSDPKITSGPNMPGSCGPGGPDWKQPFTRNKFGDFDQRTGPGDLTEGPPIVPRDLTKSPTGPGDVTAGPPIGPGDAMEVDEDKPIPSEDLEKDKPSLGHEEQKLDEGDQNIKLRGDTMTSGIDKSPTSLNDQRRSAIPNSMTKRSDDRRGMRIGPQMEFCIEKQFNYNHSGGVPDELLTEHTPTKVIDYAHATRVVIQDYVTPAQCFDYGHGGLKPSVPDHEIYTNQDFRDWEENEHNLKEYMDRMKVYESDLKALNRGFSDSELELPVRHREPTRIQEERRSFERDRRSRNDRSRRDMDDYRDREKESRERGRIEREREWDRISSKYREDRPHKRRSTSRDRTRERSENIRKESNKENNKDEERSKGNVSGQESSTKKPAESTSPDNSQEEIKNDDLPPKTMEVPKKLELPNIMEPPKTMELPKTPNFTMIDDLLCPPGRQNRPPKIVVILRGPPGSGKSFVAKLIKDKEVEQGGSAPRILSLDDYFLTEKEIETTDDNGKKVTTKEMVYEYEEAMEPSYVTSLVKAFKKNITDGFFTFIILDSINEKISDYEEMWSFAKTKGFRVYVCEMEMDVQICLKRNIHKRTEDEVNRIVDYFEPTPSYHQKLDVTSMLQEEAIEEVQMEDNEEVETTEIAANDDSQDSQEDKDSACVSKWEKMEADDKLDRLDGLARRKNEGKPQTMEDFLQVPDYYDMEDTSGKKRVRWADLEERKEQEKMRAVGFVVGQTNWDRMMDPTKGGSALTRTKYI